MKNILNPKWLFLINTLPIIILLILCNEQYQIIKTLLKPESIELWKSFGLSLVILGLLNFIYPVYLIVKNKSVSFWFGLLALFAYIPFLYVFGNKSNEFIPFSIPNWMVAGNIYMYVGTFLMPTIAYSLFILVTHFTPNHKENKPWVNFLLAIAIPLSIYLFTHLVLPLWQPTGKLFNTHTILIIVIAATLLFHFFLIRGVYILTLKRSSFQNKYQLIWKIPITIILPILGLLINNGHIESELSSNETNIFGDFSDLWFYIIAGTNGIFLCLPNLKNTTYRLFLFIVRNITFAYTLYFFLVFLPFLPLSIIAIIAIGIGFLMLTPIMLFVVHIKALSNDIQFLSSKFSKKTLIILFAVSFLCIPSMITISYKSDKAVLHEALDYLYSPDYSKHYNIDKNALSKTLNVINKHKDNARTFQFSIISNETPYFSAFYNWIVLDNLTLSNAKINAIEKVFYNNSTFSIRKENIRNQNVNISQITTNSTYDKTQNVWKTWVDLELTNQNESSRFSEYATTIDLPEGCWISDYYLFVGDKKEPGILAEKKSAMWVFSQIRNTNRDPGILYYLTGNKVAFRVFPFEKNAVRKTGIEFIHKEPLTLKIDSHVVAMGDSTLNRIETVETEAIDYVSAQEKLNLPVVKRKPYFHFLVDVSLYQKEHSNDYVSRIENVLKSHPNLKENSKLTFVNSYAKETNIQEDWKTEIEKQPYDGGFYLDRAIRKTLIQAHSNTSSTYPVLVAVSGNLQNAILDKDFSDLKFTFPENNLFFHLNQNGELIPHSLLSNPEIERLTEVNKACMFCDSVLEYSWSNQTKTYLPNNNKASLVLKKPLYILPKEDLQEKHWLSALKMEGQWRSQLLHPEKSDDIWINMIKNSFLSKTMTPVTSYIVVENEAQKAMLKKKQQDVLSGKRALDLDEDSQRMSEPGLFIILILFGLIVWLRKKYKKNALPQ